MKKKFSEELILIIILPFALVVGVIFFLYTPVDIIRYRCSRYYKDERIKYFWLAGMSDCVKMYGIIKKEGFPIECYTKHSDRKMDWIFFVYGDTVIFPDREVVLNEDTWEEEINDKYVPIEKTLGEELSRANKFLGEDICRRVAVFGDENDVKLAAGQCPDGVIVVPRRGSGVKTAHLRRLMEMCDEQRRCLHENME